MPAADAWEARASNDDAGAGAAGAPGRPLRCALGRAASNLLINNQGQLKLADFGLARALRHVGDDDAVGPHAPQAYTNRVITIGYRPPELLLGATFYGTAVDMWSAGCILPELFLRKALFRGCEDEISQLALIFQLCGSPEPDVWPDGQALPWMALMRPRTPLPRILTAELARSVAPPPPRGPRLAQRLSTHAAKHPQKTGVGAAWGLWPSRCSGHALSSAAIDLTDRLLALDPKKRLVCEKRSARPRGRG